MLLVNSEDELVPLDQATRMDGALTAAGVAHQTIVVPRHPPRRCVRSPTSGTTRSRSWSATSAHRSRPPDDVSRSDDHRPHHQSALGAGRARGDVRRVVRRPLRGGGAHGGRSTRRRSRDRGAGEGLRGAARGRPHARHRERHVDLPRDGRADRDRVAAPAAAARGRDRCARARRQRDDATPQRRLDPARPADAARHCRTRCPRSRAGTRRSRCRSRSRWCSRCRRACACPSASWGSRTRSSWVRPRSPVPGTGRATCSAPTS